jgi:sulfonate transport system ATP-binding protein
MLVLDRLGKTYPNGVHALERFSADIRLGEIVHRENEEKLAFMSV